MRFLLPLLLAVATAASQPVTSVKELPEFAPNRIQLHFLQEEWMLQLTYFSKVNNEETCWSQQIFYRASTFGYEKVPDPSGCKLGQEKLSGSPTGVVIVSLLMLIDDDFKKKYLEEERLAKQQKREIRFFPPPENILLYGYRYGGEGEHVEMSNDPRMNYVVSEIHSARPIKVKK